MKKIQGLPGLSGWIRHAGGTFAEEGKYGYTINRDGVKWSVHPLSYKNGRHMGYGLWAFGLPNESGYVWFDKTGAKNYVGRSLFRSPQEAVKIARIEHSVKLKRGY